MSADVTASRFLRPPDVARLRRNQRRIQVQRLIVVFRALVVIGTCVAAAVWMYRHTQSDERFAVRSVEVRGAVHAPHASVDEITRRYVGMNLFRIDLEQVQNEMREVSWVRQIEVEKALPDTLRIVVAERTPVALLRSGDRLLYVDEEGVGFAELSPAVGNDDLPIISEAEGTELARTLHLLRDLRDRQPEIYSRISEIAPVPPRGFAIYDRGFQATVYGNADDLAPKFRSLAAILAAEEHPPIEYADLRFVNRIVVKPQAQDPASAAVHLRSSGSLPPVTQRATQHGGGEYVQD